MRRLADMAEKLVHTRELSMSTFAVDEGRMLCVGRFNDVRTFPSIGFNRNRFDAGDLHDMEIAVLVGLPDLVIQDIEVTIRAVPLRDCRLMEGSLDAVIGLSVSRGFAAEVKRRSGGARGCTHLVHLLTTMGPAILQGYWSLQDMGREDSGDAPGKQKVSAARFLANSCYAWRTDGEAFGALGQLGKDALDGS
ncbi:MAG: DUF2889 domain-containing protein [Spirochaetia bacterium]|nr:DUF2889 domain-containing protein [Spirochaetia bacterium]